MKTKPETTAFIRKRLPHWEVMDGRYFVTICQFGAIPSEAAAKIRNLYRELENLSGGAMLDHQRKILWEMENWLDRTDAKGDLTIPQIASMLMEAIEHRDSQGEWRVHGFVIMPNHMHL